MKSYLKLLIVPLLLIWVGCGEDNPVETPPDSMQVVALRMGTVNLLEGEIDNVPTDQPLVISFSVSIDRSTITDNVVLMNDADERIELTVSYLDSDETLSSRPTQELSQNTNYTIQIGVGVRGINGEIFPGTTVNFRTLNPPLEVMSSFVDGDEFDLHNRIKDISTAPEVEIRLHFSEPIKTSDLENKVFLTSRFDTIIPEINEVVDSIFTFTIDGSELEGLEKYRFSLSSSIDFSGKDFEGFAFEFYTKLDSTLKFPEISDDELLTKVQEQTFKYFWDFGHPTSGMARERNTSGETVTIGGSGFGVMAILVAIERGFVSRQNGIARLVRIANFLENADRFHGVWPHWMNGTTGKTIPFSNDDDGGDLVETSFMIQGLLTVRQYLNEGDTEEAALKSTITKLWEEVEWDWYTQNGQDVLYWHWSENFGWQKNHRISGWNEALIVYVLAASSPTHPIGKEVYDAGWARSGAMANGNDFYNITLPLGSTLGGPLFFSHYSFLGLDPRNLSDQYANYWEQNVAHSQINQAYCTENANNYVGYSAHSWGLTASDNHNGYSAHSPTNDLGVITPTAALSSIPYTPDESIAAIRHFYYILGDKLWGEYGFYDAFNPTESWYASSFLAIDQGPIICMIENHRTQLLWNLFMTDSEIQAGLDLLEFTY